MFVDAALTKEQGVTFVVVVVQKHVLTSSRSRTETANGLAVHWPGIPVVLMAQDARGRAEYWGRQDIVQFLAGVPVEALPWQRWNLT